MHDWKALNEVLFPNEVLLANAGGKRSAMLITRDDARGFNEIIYSDGTIASVHPAENQMAAPDADKTLLVSSAELDRQILDASNLGTNYFQQIAFLREKLTAGEQKKNLIISRPHFLVTLFTGTLLRFLPRRFNVLVFVDQRSSLLITSDQSSDTGYKAANYKAVLLTFENGKLDQFFEPDFSGLDQKKLASWIAHTSLIGDDLESRYRLPCFSLMMYRDVWERMLDADRTQSADPMRIFVRHCDDLRAEIYHSKNLAMKAYLFIQRLFVYFGKI